MRNSFVSTVLLSRAEWDPERLLADLGENWDIRLTGVKFKDNVMAASYGSDMISVSMISSPVPDGEAEYYARYCRPWPEAEKEVRKHVAHLLIAVVSDDSVEGTEMIEQAKLCTKVVASALKQKHVLAVYSDGLVSKPETYISVAENMRSGLLPILDWVCFDRYAHDGLDGIYTYGLKKFGYDEIEVYAKADCNDIFEFVLVLVDYVLGYNVTLRDGETIGFEDDGQKLAIRRSKGIALDGYSLKIEYPGS